MHPHLHLHRSTLCIHNFTETSTSASTCCSVRCCLLGQGHACTLTCTPLSMIQTHEQLVCVPVIMSHEVSLLGFNRPNTEIRKAHVGLKVVKLRRLFQMFLAQFHFRLQGLPVVHHGLLFCSQACNLAFRVVGQHIICSFNQLLQLQSERGIIQQVKRRKAMEGQLASQKL